MSICLSPAASDFVTLITMCFTETRSKFTRDQNQANRIQEPLTLRE